MSYQFIRVEREGRLTTIILNRPEAHNALNAAAHLELQQAFDDFGADEEQWVAIVTGSGSKAFCAGHDLKQQASGGGLVTPEKGFAGLTARFDLSKPVIAAVNGVAMGGGFELALACDIIVASENAVFALPEPRVGLAALAGGLQRLPQVIGLKRSMGMLLTGRRVSAREGVDLGFVNEVCSDDVLSLARCWAAEMLACSPLSLRATKEAVLRGLDVPIETALVEEWQYPQVVSMLESMDAIEGPRAFAEKRPPQWSGR
ncbi:enoyl-CoA hydratase [Pseudomonas sp. BN414]|uniref:enoyl-CoA hydratase-related protein n=1 Tax=unclassified Pseudomonas TaxID=196821 RepID=UPI002458AA40|nr:MULTISPECIES: enoyl-CoA hydratase-related protein [unclassified Pseudomonas]MDH4561242.1 enoyl-CoA hydratase [Pseudomonas sp. BN411]MDH4565467.1 enoyl-CoA hydratase [Pseudomonas sp. BN414]MDH4656970.1 enoyl-CoA hydratase [Pseudomonas sp. BN606]MDH4874485.1 enoyl-CoA hydratase [Pseudomonas sp. BN515]